MKITEQKMMSFFDYFTRRFFYWLPWVVVVDVALVLAFDDAFVSGAALGSAVSILYVVFRLPTIISLSNGDDGDVG